MNSAETRILWLPTTDDYEERAVLFDYETNSFTAAHRNHAGVRIDATTALQSTVVLACVRVLAETIATLPLHIYKRGENGGKTIAREHPLYRVLHTSPNSWQTSFEWREQQMLHLGTYGQSFCEIVRDSRDIVSELITLHPSRMRVERVETGKLRYTYQEETGGVTTYSQDDVMHIRWLSDDGVNGIVPIELAKDAIGLARACEIHGASFFGNGARPGVVLATDSVLSAEAAENLRNNWERVHRGPDRASRTAVLQGGLKPMEIGNSNQESQFLETRRFQIEEICRLYRVPPHLVGDLTRSSFSNIEQQSIDFVQHTLLPWLRRFETAFARDLLFDSDTYFIEFDTRGLLRGDAAARGSYYQTLYNLGVASVNEIRAWENLDPVVGGDLRFVQMNLTTLDVMNNPAAATGSDVQSVLDRLTSGAITPDAAKALIAVTNTMLTPEEIDKIVAGSQQPAQPDKPQVTALLQVITDVAGGVLKPEGATAILKASFPQLNDAQIQSMINGVKPNRSEDEAAKAAAAAQPAEPTAPEPTADVNGLLAILGQVGAGAVTPEAALSVIKAVFPAMPEGLATAIVSGVQAQQAPPAAGGETVGAAPEGTGDAAPKPPSNTPQDAEKAFAPEAVEKAQRSLENYLDGTVGESRVFCGTGKGGGKDSSCSPKDSGGVADLPNASDLTKERSLGGSTGAMLMSDKDGNQFVVKGGNSAGHIRSEVAANQIYEAAGISVPRTKLDDSDPKSPKQISEYVEAKPLASMRGADREKAIAEIQKGFAADALVANWDVVGLEQDNILVPKSGPPLRVDNGGSLTYRAQGKEKPFGPTVGELDSLRTSQQGKPIFGSLSDEQIASQIDDLSGRRSKILAATPEPLRDTMSRRLDYMEKWAKSKRRRSLPSKKDDAANAAESRIFCATGDGGGKDASCSPKEAGAGSGLSSSEKSSARAALESKFGGVKEVPVSELFPAKPGSAGRPVLMEPKKSEVSVQEVDLSKVVGSQETVPFAGLSAYIDGPPRDKRLPIVAEVHTYKYNHDTGRSEPTGDPPTLHVVAGHTRLGVQALAGRPRAKVMVARYNLHRVPISEKNPSGYVKPAKRAATGAAESRVFCATGPGGGKNPSCSPKDTGGGGGDGGSMKVVSKSSMEVGKQYKVTKLGKDYHGKVVAVEHSPDGKKTKVTLALEGGGKKSLVLMSAAKVQEKELGASANAEKKKEAEWKADVEKLVGGKDAVAAPGTKLGGKGALDIPEKGPETGKLPGGRPNHWEAGPKTDETPTPAQKAAIETASAKAAIKAYTGSAYGALNEALRRESDAKTPLPLGKAAEKLSAKLSAAQLGALSVATEIPAAQERVTYRGAGTTLAKLVAALPENGEFVDRGFGSTSRRPDIAGAFGGGDPRIQCRIRSKWGVPIGSVGSLGHGEAEILMPRNMRYRVKSREWRRDDSNRRVLYVELEGLGPVHQPY